MESQETRMVLDREDGTATEAQAVQRQRVPVDAANDPEGRMIPQSRTIYLELARISRNRRTRIIYLQNYDRVLRKEWAERSKGKC